MHDLSGVFSQQGKMNALIQQIIKKKHGQAPANLFIILFCLFE